MLTGWVAVTSLQLPQGSEDIVTKLNSFLLLLFCSLDVCLFLLLLECIGKRRGKGKPKTKDKMIPVEIIEGPRVADPFWSCR